MKDIFPKYLTTAINNGLLRFFSSEVITPIEEYDTPYGTTFCIFYSGKGDEDLQKNKAIDFAKKLIALEKRNGGSGLLGSDDWLWFKRLQNGEHPKQSYSEKVYFIKFALKGNIEKRILELYYKTPIEDINAFGKPILLNGKKGILMLSGHTSFLTSCDRDIFKKRILHTRNDHDRYKWWTTWWDDNKTHNDAVAKETSKITCELLRMFPDGLRQINTLFTDPSKLDKVSDSEGNLYYIGDEANYWIRLINRQGDYNMYVFAYEKP